MKLVGTHFDSMENGALLRSAREAATQTCRGGDVIWKMNGRALKT